MGSYHFTQIGDRIDENKVFSSSLPQCVMRIWGIPRLAGRYCSYLLPKGKALKTFSEQPEQNMVKEWKKTAVCPLDF